MRGGSPFIFIPTVSEQCFCSAGVAEARDTGPLRHLKASYSDLIRLLGVIRASLGSKAPQGYVNGDEETAPSESGHSHPCPVWMVYGLVKESRTVCDPTETGRTGGTALASSSLVRKLAQYGKGYYCGTEI